MPERTRESRRSVLQVFILQHLQKGPAKTITALAEAVNSQRPSVSRSMRLLREDGLVEPSDQGWCLTDAGLREAQEAETKLAASADKAAKALAAYTRGIKVPNLKVVDTIKPLSGLGRVRFTPLADFEDSHRKLLASLESQRPSILDVIKRVKDVQYRIHVDTVAPVTQFQRHINEVLKPLAEAQSLNLRLLTEVTATPHPYFAASVARRNNLLLTGAMDNVLALNQSNLANLNKNMSTIGSIARALPRLSEVTSSFGRLFAEQSSPWLNQSPLHLERAQSESMVLPTATMARYTESLRWLDEADTDTPPDYLPTPADGLDDEDLDPLLAEVDPVFVEMRQGSWQVLRAGGLDRLRQAAVSQREMLSQLLRRLAPDTALPEDARGKPSIKARARIILDGSRSGADFVDAVAKALFEFYNQLSKYTHQNEKHEASLRAILQTGEGLIRLIVVQAR